MNPWSTPVSIGSLMPLKYAARLVNEKRDVLPDDEYLGLDRVEPWTGRLLDETETPEATGMGVRFRRGDVLFGKLRPYLAKVLRAEADGIASTEFLVLRERKVQSRFLSYVLRTPSVISAVNAATYGAKMPRASWDDVGHLLLPVPSAAQQSDVADFLDRETVRIDALVSKQNAFLGALDEQRRSLVSNVVAAGLRTGPAVETGIEVFPRLPQHWVVRRLKHLVQPGTSISYGIVQPGPHLPGGVPFVQTADLTKRRFNPDDLQHTDPEIAAAYPRSRLRTGDVMLGVRASVGDTALVPAALDGANLSRGIARIVPGRGIMAAYLVHALSTPQAAWFWSLNMQGSTFREVSIETVRELPVPVPPLDEQAEIVARLDASLARHDTLRHRANEMIERLREHRAALITAAVTGGIAAARPLADQGPAEAAAA